MVHTHLVGWDGFVGNIPEDVKVSFKEITI
jgi:hypothetical protein